MPKLIVSNQRTDEMIGDLGSLTPEYRRYVAGQAQRMVWLAEEGDVLVLPVGLDEEFLSYVAALKGIDRASWAVVVPPVGSLGEDVLSRDRLEAPEFVARLRAAVREHEVRTILPFHFDRVSVRLARTLGLDEHTPASRSPRRAAPPCSTARPPSGRWPWATASRCRSARSPTTGRRRRYSSGRRSTQGSR